METENTISFSPSEWEVLSHRLEIPDCIAEALEDSTAEEAAEKLAGLEPRTEIPATQLNLEIFRDCVDGNTFFENLDDAVACDEVSRGKALAYRRAGRSLEDKLGVCFP